MGDNNEVSELRELLTEIKVSIGELRTEMIGMRGVASDVKEISKTANLAYQNTVQLEKRVDGLGNTLRWAVGLGISAVIGVVGTVVSIIAIFR